MSLAAAFVLYLAILFEKSFNLFPMPGSSYTLIVASLKSLEVQNGFKLSPNPNVTTL